MLHSPVLKQVAVSICWPNKQKTPLFYQSQLVQPFLLTIYKVTYHAVGTDVNPRSELVGSDLILKWSQTKDSVQILQNTKTLAIFAILIHILGILQICPPYSQISFYGFVWRPHQALGHSLLFALTCRGILQQEERQSWPCEFEPFGIWVFASGKKNNFHFPHADNTVSHRLKSAGFLS